ncbi:hypothetical protein [Mangrovimonas cancribranchiae]|uniref:STAS/SEC14 domain-containing protein n=1 Tax=Mangrovimonas cancribranchiae TaxID=3080055 RepID=A0AAU6PAW2_9FLAO
MSNKKIIHAYGTVIIQESCMISILNEGVNVSTESYQILTTIAQKQFKEKNFVYISLRKKAYSVNPLIYPNMSNIKNLVGFAVVYNDTTIIDNTEVEKLFIGLPFEVFNNLNNAIKWANKTAYLPKRKNAN